MPDQDFVLFALGMRVHHYGNPLRLMRLYRLIPQVFDEAKRSPGYLAGTYRFSMREPLIIQYWRSMEDLQAYAHQGAHAAIWKHFHQEVMASAQVGLWHEAFQIRVAEQHSNYVNMPLTGMALFTPTESIKQQQSTFSR